MNRADLSLCRQNDPHVGTRIPGAPLVIAKDSEHLEAGALETARHLRYRERAKRQREPMHSPLVSPALTIFLIEDRQSPQHHARRDDEKDRQDAFENDLRERGRG